ncbi:hypothetical protein SDRG_13796 [Saprolegnia diclina VS20]|uniref:WW domain-containing protein n=1 Tax=Saprolegnia diclina (strain VS20) TaxID=1156394 RepID=T0R8S9_SAPDV|nr:hypothetical protein SDRG_13796 [Saprolegnia diclina VS20]EQC28468.1 hypothetical protein SDRG_13796 [Saprolegnia diclina VS20]|eukprot:XP_008618116.1 hypothetical protein SDRG_13796 [Saprolegnia diclina VS20]
MSLTLRTLGRHACRVKKDVVFRVASSAAASGAYETKTQIPPPAPYTGLFSTNFDVTEPKHKARMERWKWLLELLGYFNEEATMTSKSALLFNSCVNQAAHPSFYRALDLPADFRSQQALLILHVWIAHRRLIASKTPNTPKEKIDPGKLLQEALFDRLWEDTTVRIRNQNVSELTVNKHLHEVQQRSFNQCVAYDQYFAANGAKRSLSEAISKHVLNVEPSAKPSQTALLTAYVQRELKTMQKLPLEVLETGDLPWGPPLANPSNMSYDDDEFDLIGQRYGNWRSALDVRGTRYFWNMTTRFSSWDKPTKDTK